MMCRRFVPVLALIVALLSGAVSAQEPPEGQAPEAGDPLVEAPAEVDRLSGSAEVSFVSTSGNSETQTIGAAGEIVFEPGAWRIDGKTSFIESRSDDELKARSLVAVAGASRKLRREVDAYGRLTYLQNRFSGIEQRWTAEIGAAHELLESERQTLEWEIGVGGTAEERIGDDDRSFASGQGAVVYRWRLSETASFSEEARFTQNLSAGSDWRFANAASISAGLTTIFSLKLTHTLTYVNRPVTGFETTDMTTSAAIVARF